MLSGHFYYKVVHFLNVVKAVQVEFAFTAAELVNDDLLGFLQDRAFLLFQPLVFRA